MAKKGTHPLPYFFPNPFPALSTLPRLQHTNIPFPQFSQIPYHRRSPHLHGHDWLFPHHGPTPRLSPPINDEVRSRGTEAGFIPGAEEGWAVVPKDIGHRADIED
jgi:hypothetical protein